MDSEKLDNKDLERVKTFTDAVFAIALTILVLDLRLPEGTNFESVAALKNSLITMMPKFLAFILSAILIGGNWISVMNLQSAIAKVNLFFVADLVIYLTIISLIPFCCNLIGNYPTNPFSFVAFGIVCELLAINAYFFIRQCRRTKLFHATTNFKEVKKLESSILFIILLLLGLMILAFYSTKLAFILFLVYNFIPFFITQRLNKTANK